MVPVLDKVGLGQATHRINAAAEHAYRQTGTYASADQDTRAVGHGALNAVEA